MSKIIKAYFHREVSGYNSMTCSDKYNMVWHRNNHDVRESLRVYDKDDNLIVEVFINNISHVEYSKS